MCNLRSNGSSIIRDYTLSLESSAIINTPYIGIYIEREAEYELMTPNLFESL